jgi:hypothetical protein
VWKPQPTMHAQATSALRNEPMIVMPFLLLFSA